MSETNEASGAQVETQTADTPATPAERARLTLESMSAAADAAPAPVDLSGAGQAEEVETVETVEPEVVESTPEKGDEAVAESKVPAIEWIPDEQRDRLLSSYNEDDDTFTISKDDLAKDGWLRQGFMRRKGFHEGMEKNAQVRKDQDALLRDGENWRQLMGDDAVAADFLAWRETQNTGATPVAVPEFESDAELAAYSIEQAKLQLRQEDEAARVAEQRQQADAEAISANFMSLAEATQQELGLSDDEFTAACDTLNTNIRAKGQLPWEVLTDKATFADALSEPLKTARTMSEVEKLREEISVLRNEQSKSANARTANASSPKGGSTKTSEEYPDTPEGRALRTLQDQLGNRG